MKWKLLLFVAFCAIAAGVITAVLHFANHQAPADGAVPVAPAGVLVSAAALPGRLYYRYTGPDAHYGHLAYIDVRSPGQPRIIDTLSCEVAYIAADRGICLSADRGVITTYAAILFEANTFRRLATLPLPGVPSRTRLSADGSLAAATVFLTGHGYGSVAFSTQTLLIDVVRGQPIADLETFTVFKNQAPFAARDFNFWGVTFIPGTRSFYATLSTGGAHYLIRGDIDRRRAEVVHEGVECPSLSPDLTRIAYKKRFLERGRVVWRLQILDLSTGRETALAERRSVDDQLEWLNAREVLYSIPDSDGVGGSTEVWVAAADGSGSPRLLLKNAYSPAVVR